MANTLGIKEVTMAQLANAITDINLVQDGKKVTVAELDAIVVTKHGEAFTMLDAGTPAGLGQPVVAGDIVVYDGDLGLFVKVDPAGARKYSHEVLTVRVTDHVADQGVSGDEANEMALFISKAVGQPWEKDVNVNERSIYAPEPSTSGNSPSPSAEEKAATYVVVNYDYDLFK